MAEAAAVAGLMWTWNYYFLIFVGVINDCPRYSFFVKENLKKIMYGKIQLFFRAQGKQPCWVEPKTVSDFY